MIARSAFGVRCLGTALPGGGDRRLPLEQVGLQLIRSQRRAEEIALNSIAALLGKKGELLLRVTRSLPHATEAEASFRQALDIAHRQQAKSWELRAATSLARLWQRQGKRVEAHDLLAPLYGWFTEGFDTADLQDAKVLLEELEG